MPLSTNAERTLEQVKSGLSILYGADYFTEDEWIKLDGLIHKGRYVFTTGPRSNILDEELMTFDDFEDAILPSPDSKDPIVVTETQISTPISAPISKEPSLISSESIPNQLSVETSTDETQPTTLSPERRIIAPPPPNGGLALGYTQAQLDEVKAFNAGLTKAGNKGKPKYNRAPSVVASVVDEFPIPQWLQDEESDSPTLAEQESRINFWASGVDAEAQPTAVSPTPEPSAHTGDELARGIDVFKELHGRSPKSSNDFYQPRNPNFKGPKRPDSRASNRTAKSVAKQTTRKLFATSGNVFLAYAAFPKRSAMTIEVQAGDTIKYIKHVSGIMHIGLNLRTKTTGQFPETVLEPTHSQNALIQQQRSLVQGLHGLGRERASTFASSVSTSLDRVEAMNAAEWDRESEVSRLTTATEGAGTYAPMPMRSNPGLAGSRFASLADRHSQSSDSGRQSVTQAEIRKIIREELAQGKSSHILQRHNTVPPPPENVLTKIIPKTTTCWFWKNKQDCRFTAEECIHLHADVPDNGEPAANLRLGKPTWGALADIMPPAAPAATQITSPNEMHPSIQFKLFNKSKTCYYWATEGKCNNTAVDCKYLHEYTEAGVAFKPGGYTRRKDFNWSKGRSGGVGDEADGPDNENSWIVPSPAAAAPEAVTATAWGLPDETSADLLANPNAAIWSAVEGSSAWDMDGDKYKPPHVKALEERERIDAVGW